MSADWPTGSQRGLLSFYFHFQRGLLGYLPADFLNTSMIERLRQAVTSQQQTHLECRHCGTTIESCESSCPACGSSDIAQYDF